MNRYIRRFQSTLPARGATDNIDDPDAPTNISIHAPRTGSDPAAHQPPEEAEISIHAPRTGSDASPEYRLVRETRYFNPRSPHGERRAGKNRHETGRLISIHAGVWYIPTSIHAPRTGSDQMDSAERADYRISIHAPRTGSDLSRNAFWICAKNFNPRSPHGERQTGSENHLRDTTFQSTLPARGATGANVGNMRTSKKFQSTLPARGATASCSAESCLPRYFNPRSPHGERPQNQAAGLRLGNFNPRSPHGERLTGSRYFSFSAYFNPRSPHGERLRSENNVNIRVLFQSTLPARGATNMLSTFFMLSNISIHAPRTGSDDFLAKVVEVYGKFQSTLPARGATERPTR